MAVVSRMGFPQGTAEDEARAQAVAYVRDELGDTDDVQSVEVTEGDGELIVKVVTGTAPEPPAPPVLDGEDAVALAEAARRARAFLDTYEGLGGLQ